MCLDRRDRRHQHRFPISSASAHLVDGQNLPFDVAQFLRVPQRDLVRGQQYVHLEFLVGRAELVSADDFPCRCRAYVRDNVDVWRPCRKLRLPGGYG